MMNLNWDTVMQWQFMQYFKEKLNNQKNNEPLHRSL